MIRRDFIKAAAWSTPVIAAAIATPLHAASAPEPLRKRIRFTNLTATVGAAKRTVYGNTKVQVVDGPDEVHGLSVRVVLVQGPITFEHTYSYPVLPGWGSTDIIRFEQAGFATGQRIDVFFTATANDVEMIAGQLSVPTPDWWL